MRSTLSDVDLEISAVPRLDLRPAQRTVLGLGLAEASVTVLQVRPSGKPSPATDTTTVAVEVEGRATPEPSVLQLTPGESTATFRLRSAGLGAVKVRAVAGGATGEATIYQELPASWLRESALNRTGPICM